MVDHTLARDATALLSVAIAEIFSGVKPVIIAGLCDSDYAGQTQEIERIGGDIAILGAAIGVLARRSGPTVQR
ncbi:MAG: hypothetical protein Q8M88_10255 [Phenylobacterium sp.]|uniref:hypothetical protein n=1 Tax=Phenylobacterium sp. TaxID=1871053 RepID=UPI00273567B1|nr:hypothetical protein [Phenylobacterium sp.]MDP3174804.1 hypothetical protein [Phenylobacterium sp.]